MFGAKSRKSERGELELLRSLIKLANDLQSSLELHEVVRVIVTAVSETFGFREATLYLREPGSEEFRALGTVSERPDYDEIVFSRQFIIPYFSPPFLCAWPRCRSATGGM